MPNPSPLVVSKNAALLFFLAGHRCPVTAFRAIPTRMSTSTPRRVLEVKYPCVHRIAPHTTFKLLPEHTVHPFAFSSTAVQFIKGDALPAPEDGFWVLPDEIRADNVEDEVKQTL